MVGFCTGREFCKQLVHGAGNGKPVQHSLEHKEQRFPISWYVPQRVSNSTSLYPIYFGKCCPPLTYLGGLKGRNSIHQNRAFYCGEPSQFHFFEWWANQIGLLQKRGKKAWEAPHHINPKHTRYDVLMGTWFRLWVLWMKNCSHEARNQEHFDLWFVCTW